MLTEIYFKIQFPSVVVRHHTIPVHDNLVVPLNSINLHNTLASVIRNRSEFK